MTTPITFVSWRWQPSRGYRSTFAPETVYALREMLEKHYHAPHRFVCVTDEPDVLPGIETIPLWPDLGHLKSPIGHSYPSCYRRLKVFAPDAGVLFGERLVSIDLDTVIVGDITPIFQRTDDFVIWGSSDFRSQGYCGSLWMLTTGTRPQVWTQFDERTSPAMAWKAGCRGSDQGWIRYVLGPNEPTFGHKDGIYSFRKDIVPRGGKLPPGARMVFFHGKHDPWDRQSQQLTWVRQHYPMAVPA